MSRTIVLNKEFIHIKNDGRKPKFNPDEYPVVGWYCDAPETDTHRTLIVLNHYLGLEELNSRKN